MTIEQIYETKDVGLLLQHLAKTDPEFCEIQVIGDDDSRMFFDYPEDRSTSLYIGQLDGSSRDIDRASDEVEQSLLILALVQRANRFGLAFHVAAAMRGEDAHSLAGVLQTYLTSTISKGL